MPAKKLRKDNADDRQAQRITKVLPLECKILEMPVFQTGQSPLREGDNFPGRSINFSESGLLVNSDFYMDPKTKLEVTISLGKKSVKLVAVVARSRRNAVDLYGRWGMGMHVLEIEPKNFNLLTSHFDSEEAS